MQHIHGRSSGSENRALEQLELCLGVLHVSWASVSQHRVGPSASHHKPWPISEPYHELNCREAMSAIVIVILSG